MFFDVYTLPYLVINAGQESLFLFGLSDEDGAAIRNVTCNCDMVEYCNEGAPIASWQVPIEYDSGEDVTTLSLKFAHDVTKTLHGKYIYQLTTKLSDGTVSDVRKGILFVRSNIAESV